jgi:heat shock protein HspQ
MEFKQCKFRPGQIVHHKRYQYRGVVLDVDVSCQATDDWYNGNHTQPKRNQPWYQILVDDDNKATYVAEENLEEDETCLPVNHPLIDQVFLRYKNGGYERVFDA